MLSQTLTDLEIKVERADKAPKEPTLSLSDPPKPAAEEFSSMLHEFGARAIVEEAGLSAIAQTGSSTSISPEARTFAHLVDLHNAIDQTHTKLGSVALMCDLIRPPTTLDGVMARREAIEELRSNTELRVAIEGALTRTQKKFFLLPTMEDEALTFFIPGFNQTELERMNAVEGLKLLVFQLLNSERGLLYSLKALGAILKEFENIPTPQSQLLREWLNSIKTVLASPDAPLLDGKICRTWNSVDARVKIPWWKPAFSSTSAFVNVEAVLLNSLLVFPQWMLGLGTIKTAAESGTPTTIPWMVAIASSVQTIVSLARLFKVGMGLGAPLRKRIMDISALGKALDCVGHLDAMLSLASLPERLGPDCSFPTFHESNSFELQAESLHNPVVLLRGRSVANTMSITGGTTQMLTGPNSGGKTTLVTAVFQNQILAQLGTVVAAQGYQATVADQLIFQGPSYQALGEHGRFGTELIATREAFLKATPKSLVVLDEVGDGTTAEERTELATAIIWGFSRIKCGVLLVSHNIALADRLAREGLATVGQMEMKGNEPTYRYVPGISRCSNAERVARQLRFSPDDIRTLLAERGL